MIHPAMGKKWKTNYLDYCIPEKDTNLTHLNRPAVPGELKESNPDIAQKKRKVPYVVPVLLERAIAVHPVL